MQPGTTVWKAEPHTIAKITILKEYLFRWFLILGRAARNHDLLYVDGFAGPGEYTNHPDGSPIAALVAAQQARARVGSNWSAGYIHCAFIELDKDRYENLKTRVGPYESSRGVKIHIFNDSFVDGLEHLKMTLPTFFRESNPLFVFIDPFGATGAPFSKVSEILASPRSEVLINLDADGIGRIFYANKDDIHRELLNDIFGDNSWGQLRAYESDPARLYREVLNLYRKNLRALPRVRYVFPFEMRSRATSLDYFLVFASQHPRGLEKMKEAMKRVDQTGGYVFSDARLDQGMLFRFDEPQDYSLRLFERFRGVKGAKYTDINDFALNETPFIDPRSMLKVLESRAMIKVNALKKRKKGTFNEGDIASIDFADEAPPETPSQPALFN